PVIAQRRREEREQPDAGNAQVLEVVELGHQTGKIADAVVVRVKEGPYVQLIDNRVFIPERIGGARELFHSVAPSRGYALRVIRHGVLTCWPFRGNTRNPFQPSDDGESLKCDPTGPP